MGLLSGLLTAPLAPLRGVRLFTEKMADLADAQMYDPSRIRAELRTLARDQAEGRITEEEFDRAEDELLDLLETAEWRGGADGEPADR